MPEPQNHHSKNCRRCRGYCPAGLPRSGLCLDCERALSSETAMRLAFALALAARGSFWKAVVWNNSLTKTT